MALWPGDKGHTVPGPGRASDWVTLGLSVSGWGREADSTKVTDPFPVSLPPQPPNLRS